EDDRRPGDEDEGDHFAARVARQTTCQPRRDKRQTERRETEHDLETDARRERTGPCRGVDDAVDPGPNRAVGRPDVFPVAVTIEDAWTEMFGRMYVRVTALVGDLTDRRVIEDVGIDRRIDHQQQRGQDGPGQPRSDRWAFLS